MLRQLQVVEPRAQVGLGRDPLQEQPPIAKLSRQQCRAIRPKLTAVTDMATMASNNVVTVCPWESTWASPKSGTAAIGDVRMIP